MIIACVGRNTINSTCFLGVDKAFTVYLNFSENYVIENIIKQDPIMDLVL